MAANNNQNVWISDGEVNEGHDVLFCIPVRILAAMKSEPFNMDYNINCRNLPTSWRLGITYEQNPETGKVSCFVTLSRTDIGNGILHASLLLSYIDGSNRFVRYPKLVGDGPMYPGGKMQGSVEESRHPGLRSYIFSLGLFLRVSMFVRYCHSGIQLQASAYSNIDAKNARLSKI